MCMLRTASSWRYQWGFSVNRREVAVDPHVRHTHWVLSSSSAATAETKGTKRLWWSSSRTIGSTASYRSLQMSPKMCAADAEIGWSQQKDTWVCNALKGLKRLKGRAAFYLHIWGFKQQVAEWCVAGRWQHRVFYVGQLQTQGSQIIRLRLAAIPFWLEKIPENPREQRQHDADVRRPHTWPSPIRRSAKSFISCPM